MSIICLIAVGIAACVYESQIAAAGAYYVIRPGAYAAAGALALAAVVCYVVGILASVPFLINLFTSDEDECCNYYY
jgi:hypothetical protein